MLWILDSIDTPWGEFGRVLHHGMTRCFPRTECGRIRLARTGPALFPITFPGASVVVTDGFRRAYCASGLSGASFQAVEKSHIVRLDWCSWDPGAEEPAEYPRGGEPSGYLLEREHCEVLAESMGDLWELVPCSDPAADILRLPETFPVVINDRAKHWFSRHYIDFVAFRSLAEAAR